MDAGKKFRMTRQRKVILDILQNDPDHPTADEVYERVRGKLPHISLGTVYRNLDVLATCGLIRKLEPDRSQMRFESETSEHYHTLCTRCGKIEDAPIEVTDNAMELLENAMGKLTRYGIFGHKLEFLGLCRDCRERELKESKKGFKNSNEGGHR